MNNRQSEYTSIMENLPFKLNQSARVSELLGRNYYKKYIKNKKSILELDEFIILSYIKKYPSASQSDIAKMVLKGKAHVGKILTNLENRGFITRSINMDHNVMIKQTMFTEEGLRLYIETDKAFVNLAKETLDIFTKEEIDLFVSLLDKYRNYIFEKFEILF